MKLGLRVSRSIRALRRRFGFGHAAGPAKSHKYNVWLYGKWIDAVFHTSPYGSKREREEDVKRSLVDHDGYDAGIKVKEAKK